ncbi:FAD-dependent tricarballylate dehydrogenase TcuA [Geomicrobium sp. JCM 19055]|uniref:FAD-dependent tricarballylate dehydrogenase TcuA n=1 Tax=Geomicrobium sp. JCM 19055 TaxID=1460649 RepID=UPI00045ED9AF|nr:FAD-dependent tricarballylate dehydrogenase TcuA [Geomicrobium sp. JCM 19055]GAJ98293.1 fumarate reductase flavoprotein subunit [Geomicrobium sp. JCM 19055]
MESYSKSYDVIVVGGGNAAFSAAISAREKGASVLVVEKGSKDKRGGNSYFTDGAIRMAYGDLEGLRSVYSDLKDDDYDRVDMPVYGEKEYYDDIMRVTNGKSQPALAKVLTSQSYPTIKWMQSHGVEFIVNENQYFEKDNKMSFWGGLPVKTYQKGIGLMTAWWKRADELGVDVLYNTKGTSLVKSDNAITGLVVEQDGKEMQIETKSVILACGGFEASEQKRMKYIGDEWKNAVVRGTEHNTGDGLDMAIEAGATPFGDWSACHAHTTDYNAPRVGDFEKPGDIYKKSSYPLGLIVNNEGVRFVDEGADFRNYTYAKYGKETLKQPEQKAFQLYDQKVRPLLRVEYELEEASVVKADSLEELAEKMNVPKEKFLETIHAYNASVQEGDYDPSVKDGKSTKGLTPAKSNWALTFDETPFYAYPVTCGITFTFGGIKVNDQAEVLNSEEQPIGGLYAAGEMVGGLFYENYPGGSGLMSGAVFGKLSGETAASYVETITTKA